MAARLSSQRQRRLLRTFNRPDDIPRKVNLSILFERFNQFPFNDGVVSYVAVFLCAFCGTCVGFAYRRTLPNPGRRSGRREHGGRARRGDDLTQHAICVGGCEVTSSRCPRRPSFLPSQFQFYLTCFLLHHHHLLSSLPFIILIMSHSFLFSLASFSHLILCVRFPS